jgi:hypothetical protein
LLNINNNTYKRAGILNIRILCYNSFEKPVVFIYSTKFVDVFPRNKIANDGETVEMIQSISCEFVHDEDMYQCTSDSMTTINLTLTANINLPGNIT